MKRFLLILILYINYGCYADLQINYEIVSVESAMNQINSTGYNAKNIFESKNKTTLTNIEIETLKRILNSSIETYNNKRQPFQQINIEDYKFYFVPTINEKQEKWIFIYGNCNKDNDLDDIGLALSFLVDDGGKCYVQTVINLTRKIEGWIVTNSNA